MKIFRSACKTRVLFQKGDNLFSKPLSDIGDVRLEDQFVVILDKSGNEISKSEVAVTEVPDYASGEDKVVSLINWLLCGDGCCDSSCDDPCNERYYYDTLVQATEITFGFIGSGAWTNLPILYDLPEGLDCNSILEVHLQLSFTGTVTNLFYLVADALVDDVVVVESRSYAPCESLRTVNTLSMTFAIEGDQSGKVLSFRVGNNQNLPAGIENIYANLIVKRIR